MFGGGWYTKAR